MTRATKIHWLSAMMIATALLAAGASRAVTLSDLHLGRWDGVLETDFGVERDQTRSPDGTLDVQSSSRRAREGLTIRNQGFFFVTPGLASGNLALTLALSQDREIGNGSQDARRAKLVGYTFDSSIFAALPYNGTVYANRSQTVLYAPFARTELALENRGTIFRLREDSPLKEHGLPYFNVNVSAEQQHSREATTSALGQAFSSDELRNSFS